MGCGPESWTTRLPPSPTLPFHECLLACMNYVSICALAHCVSFSLKTMVLWAVFFFFMIPAHPDYSVFIHGVGPAAPAHTGSIFMFLTLSDRRFFLFSVCWRRMKSCDPWKKVDSKCCGCIQAAIFLMTGNWDGLEGVWVLNELQLGFWMCTYGWLRGEMIAGGWEYSSE